MRLEQEHSPWTWEVTKNASDQPFLDLGKAFAAFLEGLRQRKRMGALGLKSRKNR